MFLWPIASIVLITAAIIAIELPYMRRNNMKRELVVFSILLAAGFGLSLTEALEITIPNPLDWMTYVFRPYSDLVYGSLK
ncbi:hypothetical protein [Paenibacillus sp. MBLB4367]|uniref:hypothetical protein n=1 Tax=Paenibacillus sp. MBLB4367 TaxID=3384767 RepID=UPI003907F1C7